MTHLFAAISLLAIPARPSEVISLEVDGVKREALVYSSESANAPLVFGFHGHGGNMRNAARSFQMHELWPEAVVVYMQGLPSAGRTDPEGKKPGWQIALNDLGGRDLKFFDALLAKLRKEQKIDSKRIYAMGHSNGGRFTYVLAAARNDVFAAFGPSGSPATGMLFRIAAKPFFHIAGETDPIVSYQSQAQTIEGLKGLLKVDPSKAARSGYLTTYPGEKGLELATYIIPGGHTYPREANARMAAFFQRHPKR